MLHLVAVFALGCAATPDTTPARVRVEVLRGLSADTLAVLGEERPVHVVLDLGAAPDAGRETRALHSLAIRQAATRYLAALPATTPVALHVTGTAKSEHCGAPERISPLEGDLGGAAIATRIDSILPGEPGSIGRALASVAEELAARDANGQAAARVVVFSNFAEDCASHPCASARSLLEIGAEIELVAIGEKPVPQCLEELAVPANAAPQAIASLTAPAELLFRVEPRGRRPAAPDGAVFVPGAAVGRTGGEGVEVAAGLVRVVIDLDPELAVWPVRLRPGELTRIRVLDFPMLGVRRSFIATEEPGRTPLVRTRGGP
jgi:hypothetical protein